MKRLIKKVSDYLTEVRENYENVDTHKDLKDEQDFEKTVEVQHPGTTEDKDKSLYSFNRLKRK